MSTNFRRMRRRTSIFSTVISVRHSLSALRRNTSTHLRKINRLERFYCIHDAISVRNNVKKDFKICS